MGSFIGGGGNLTGAPTPDIPVADFITQGSQVATGYKKAGWWQSLFASFWAGLMDGVTVMLTFLAEGFDRIMTVWLKVLTAAQGLNNPAFFTACAAMVSDLLGIEISPTTMQQAWQQHGQVAGMAQLGGAFLNQLVGEFQTGSRVTPEAGLQGAEAFLGFLLSFSVREANIEFISSIIPEEYRFGEGIRKYAVDMAQNVGLGRLARRVLQAPINALITTPLTWHYNEKYRPWLFPIGEMFRSYTRGFINEQLLDQQMGYHGIPQEWKQPLIQEYQRVPFQSEFFREFQFGKMTEDEVLKAYESLGYSPEISKLMFDYTRLNDANTEVTGILTDLESQRLSNFIDEPTFRNLVDSLPVAPDRKQYYLNRVGNRLEFPRKALTLSEMQDLFVEGIIDESDLSDFLKGLGYSDDDQYRLLLLTALKLHTAEAKYTAAKFAYDQKVAKAQAKNQPIPPPPALVANPPA